MESQDELANTGMNDGSMDQGGLGAAGAQAGDPDPAEGQGSGFPSLHLPKGH